nr:hypothetical protein [Tanacetum cinerariifolium]
MNELPCSTKYLRLTKTISSKDVVFTKGEKSPYKTSSNVTSKIESVNDTQEPLPPLPKLLRAEPMVTEKESTVKYVKKKAQTKIPSVLDSSLEKKADSSTEKLLFTLMKEVNGLKEQIKPSSDNLLSVSQIGSSKLDIRGYVSEEEKCVKEALSVCTCVKFKLSCEEDDEYEICGGECFDVMYKSLCWNVGGQQVHKKMK